MNWLTVFLAAAVILAVRPRWVWLPYDLYVVWRVHRRDCVSCSPIFQSSLSVRTTGGDRGVAPQEPSSWLAGVTPHTNKEGDK